MTEESMIQHLYDQIDRLISMQSTMLTIVGVLFTLIIAVFAFFQWRINNRDQEVIIKSAKEELLSNLIQNYNLLGINENQHKLEQNIEENEKEFKNIKDTLHNLNNKQRELELRIKVNELSIKQYLVIEKDIMDNAEHFKEVNNKKRETLLSIIFDFGEDELLGELKKPLAEKLFHIVMVHSKEKMSYRDFIKKYSNEQEKERSF
ncbi:hypothetical protein [Oceanobacillus sp. FSL W7-1309]|uniref:hypothetical protein n=1 Tax=Oceanobacillus sp. FSL W7-1309 TaxID=2954539 RepID=UPI0030FABCA4